MDLHIILLVEEETDYAKATFRSMTRFHIEDMSLPSPQMSSTHQYISLSIYLVLKAVMMPILEKFLPRLGRKDIHI